MQSNDIYRGLGDMYVNDPRFTKNIDKAQAGLAAFFREAIHDYCVRSERGSGIIILLQHFRNSRGYRRVFMFS
ncbi:MAG: MerR family transcriptional regulator [Paenibacillus sp.]|nr:MerR family transcriptional regulator [Paenibacillus sp.]